MAITLGLTEVCFGWWFVGALGLWLTAEPRHELLAIRADVFALIGVQILKLPRGR